MFFFLPSIFNIHTITEWLRLAGYIWPNLCSSRDTEFQTASEHLQRGDITTSENTQLPAQHRSALNILLIADCYSLGPDNK